MAVPYAAPGFNLMSILGALNPQQKQMLSQSLAGGAGTLATLLATGREVPIGAALGAVGAGVSGGLQQAREGIQLGQDREVRSQIAQSQLGMQQAEAQRAEQERARREAIIASMPPEQRALVEAAQVLPGPAFDRAFPKPIDPSQRYKVVGSDLFDISGEGGPEMVARGSRDAGPLVPIFDPESGQTTYGTRAQAVGQMAPPKSGMQVYDSQGNLLVSTGSGGAEGMQKKTAATIEDKMLQLGDRMQRLDLVVDSYKPEFSQVLPRAQMEWSALKDKFGQLGPDEKQTLQDFTAWKQNAFDDLNQTLKEMSGAAINEHEMTRLVEAAPDPGKGVFDGDSPSEFKAKLDNQRWKAQLAYARLHYYRSRGLPMPNFAAGENGGTSLEDMPGIIDARGKELEQQVAAQNPGMPAELIQMQVDRQLRAEFGFRQ